MNRPEIAVTGLGMVTAAGAGTEATWQAVCAGRSLATTDPALKTLATDFSCRADLDATELVPRTLARRTDRITQLALYAATEAVRDAGLDPHTWPHHRVGVVIACGLAGQWTFDANYRRMAEVGLDGVSPLLVPKALSSTPAAEIALTLGARGPSMAPASACSSAATALALAHDLLALDRCDIVIAGGTESTTTPYITTSFARLGALSRRSDEPERASRPFDRDRDGFVMGEGAAVLVLERTADARARRAAPRALLLGHAATNDAHHPTAPHPDGTHAESALRTALADAGLAAGDIRHVHAHGTSTPMNDAVEGHVIARVLPHGPSVTSAKGVLGHTLGAAGAVSAGLTVLTLQHQLVPPIANLELPDPALDIDLVAKTPRPDRIQAAVTNSCGFGGHNVSLVLHRP